MTATEIRRQWIHPQFGAAAGVFTLMVLYGSLYPFQFRPRPGSPLAELLADGRDLSSRADLLSTVLLYLLLGFFGVRALAAGSAFRKAAAVFAFGLALSLSMECVQFYEPRRVASLSDVYANAAGALAG